MVYTYFLIASAGPLPTKHPLMRLGPPGTALLSIPSPDGMPERGPQTPVVLRNAGILASRTCPRSSSSNPRLESTFLGNIHFARSNSSLLSLWKNSFTYISNTEFLISSFSTHASSLVSEPCIGKTCVYSPSFELFLRTSVSDDCPSSRSIAAPSDDRGNSSLRNQYRRFFRGTAGCNSPDAARPAGLKTPKGPHSFLTVRADIFILS